MLSDKRAVSTIFWKHSLYRLVNKHLKLLKMIKKSSTATLEQI